ncbi:MAG: response regulator [Bacteroidetes bacterium]|nr:MAG: response regulator [Bacteroidota bacterium]
MNQFGILYLDDEATNLRIFKTAFKRYYNVFTAITVDEALHILRTENIELIITDQRMPEMSGVEFLNKIIPEFPNPLRIILTGFSDVEAIIQAINDSRIFKYVTKPWDKDNLKQIIDEALGIYETEKEKLNTLGSSKHKIVSLEDEIKALQEEIARRDAEIHKLKLRLDY